MADSLLDPPNDAFRCGLRLQPHPGLHKRPIAGGGIELAEQAGVRMA
jgi:hypothetical protein